jgi:hypothetical protein
MRGLPQIPKEYFDKFKDKKVNITSWDPKSKNVALRYVSKLKHILKDVNAEIIHKGSTAYQIAGKGEIEIGVYPNEADWEETMKLLEENIGEVNNLENNYARFNDNYEGFEIEVILMKGYDAVVDKKLTEFLMNSKQLLEEYKKLKYKYSYSKKDYMIAKDKFFRKVISKI